jgi:hypothetical protein
VFRETIEYYSRAPRVCLTGEEVNSVQKAQCAEFWERLGMRLMLLLVPFVAVTVFFALGWMVVRSRVAKAQSVLRSVLDSGGIKPVGHVIVGSPQLRAEDFFAWVHGVRVLKAGDSKNAGEGAQAVYFLRDQVIPLPGQKIALYEWGHYFGRIRYIAEIHAPHLKVVGGK